MNDISQLLPPSASQLERDLVETFHAHLQTLLYTPDPFIFIEFADLWKENLPVGPSVKSPAAIPIRYLWDPWRCPERFLPYLACVLSVNPLIFNFKDNQGNYEPGVRAFIANSVKIHERAGTRWSLRNAVKLLGYTIADDGIKFVTDDPSNRAYRLNRWMEYEVTVKTLIPNHLVDSLWQLIESTAPLRCRLVKLIYEALQYYDGIDKDDDSMQTALTYDGTYTYGEII